MRGQDAPHWLRGSEPVTGVPGSVFPLTPAGSRSRTSLVAFRREGFSLIEMIVATAILATAIIGLLTLTSVSLSNAAVIREYDRASMLARAKMSELLEVSPLPLGEVMAGAFDESTRWEVRTEPFDIVPPAIVGRAMLVRVELTVVWVAREREKFIQLEGYRSMRIQPEHERFLGDFR